MASSRSTELFRSGVVFSLVLSIFTFTATSSTAAPRQKRALAEAARLNQSALRNPNREIEVFIRLDEPAVAELNAQSVETSGELASPEAQRAQAARVVAQQSAFKPALQSRGARVLSAQRVGANGFRISVRPSEVAGLSALAGVRSIARVERHRPDNAQSVPWIGAPAVWTKVGKGKGVRIGIIDTGIDYTHATFGGAGTPEAYAANNPNVVEPGSFPVPGGAVRGGIDLAGATYNADLDDSVPVPDNDPLDVNGHGSHVGGTAAGRGVSGSVGTGVAPAADLYAIKVFGDVAGSTNLTSLGIEWALDPNGDGDMSDRMDVINMSLGSPFGDPNDPSSISADNAAKLGVIVVASAGNEATTPYVTGAPAVAPSAISVAGSIPGGRDYSRFTVTAPPAVAGVYASLEGAGPVTFKAVGPLSGALAPATPANGCTPITSDVSGKIAFVIRGVCDFLVKYTNAQNAGATAIVVYNDGVTPDRVEPLIMGGLNDTITIPGLMISSTSGFKLLAATGVQATIDVAADPTKDDGNYSASSLGPSSGNSGFKPDLTAPGESIVSAAVGTGTGSANFSGTSMAAPHVSGAAALLRQQHPKLDQAGIKALLQNSAVDVNPTADGRLTRQGAGVIRVDRAAALTGFAKPGGVSFGRLNPLFPIVRSEKITITNLSNRSRSYSVSHVPKRKVPGVKVTCPSNINVGGSRSTKADITLKFDPAATAAQGGYDDGVVSQQEVDGFCVFKDGKEQIRVGYLAVVDPASSVIVTPSLNLRSVNVRNLGPAVGFAEGFTLAKLGGEVLNGSSSSIAATGFRRADPEVYGLQVLEFGMVTEKPFNHLSRLTFDMLIDVNSDGVPDFEMVGADLSAFQDVDPGTFVTAQFPAAGNGFLDWIATSWDYNDRAFILPFTLEADGGFLPEKFDYTLYLSNGDGTEDIQHGSVDLSKEIVPDLNSFAVDPGEKINVGLSGGKGLSLWLLQNNPLAGQMGVAVSK